MNKGDCVSDDKKYYITTQSTTMPSDKLKQFVSLRDELTAEKRALELRLAQLNRILGSQPAVEYAPSAPAAPVAGQAPAVRRSRKIKRLQNDMSLKTAILRVNTKPMTKQEILAGVQKLGYKFATSNPMNSVNVILYGRKPRFENDNGKFRAVGIP